jgi:hypothetical protein
VIRELLEKLPKYLMRKYPYLPRDVLEKVTSVKPRVLIGQDNQTLMVAREVVEPDPLGLMITKTKLGWNVHGGNIGGSTQEAIVNICYEERDECNV